MSKSNLIKVINLKRVSKHKRWVFQDFIHGTYCSYSRLIKRYPLAKHMVGKQSLPEIDYLYLDMNGIIYKCVKVFLYLNKG